MDMVMFFLAGFIVVQLFFFARKVIRDQKTCDRCHMSEMFHQGTSPCVYCENHEQTKFHQWVRSKRRLPEYKPRFGEFYHPDGIMGYVAEKGRS